MNVLEKLGLAAMHRIDPEQGHRLAIKALNAKLVPSAGTFTSERLATTLAGLQLPNPVGLAAGFDKNATAIRPLLKQGFGFIEVGAATPKPQPGNAKPRLFRLAEDQAAINRFGFNNDGMNVIAARLAKRPKNGVVGLNLGANKSSSHRAIDFVQVLETCGTYIDFATVNVSSPNTEKLRDLQGEKALNALLAGVMKTRDNMERPIPVFLKIAPDLDTEEIAQIAQVARHNRIDGIIATNTTLDRVGLTSQHAHEGGGLSGKPLFKKSTRVLAQLYAETEGSMPLIGVGGISTADQAMAKIEAGASAIQIYTALVYHGFSVADDIARGLDRLLAQRGYDTLADAVGSGYQKYL